MVAQAPRLTWTYALHHHLSALSQFVCTDPPKHQYDPARGRYHPRQYELEVQSHLRGLKVPMPVGEWLILGLDREGVAAAVHFGFDDTKSQLMIWALACARRCQGRGYGAEALQVTLSQLARMKAAKGLDCGIFTFIDQRNEASRTVFKGAGFEFLSLEDGYEVWLRDL